MEVSQLILAVLLDIAMGFLVAIGWSMLFNTPKKVLLIAGLLGGLGHSLRYLLLEGFGLSIIPATLSGTILIGLLGIILARKVDTPPVVFTMPACITMIPGMYAYHTMLGIVKIAGSEVALQDPMLIPETVRYFVLTASLLFTLSIGITIGSLLFRKKTAREISLHIPLFNLMQRQDNSNK